MYRKILIVFLYFLFTSFFVTGQVFRYKIGANYSGFIREAGKKENLYTDEHNLPVPASTPFTNGFDFGFETELIRPWTNNLETGLEIEYAKYSGSNETPPYYNFIFTDKVSSILKPEEINSITYNSSSFNFLANLKYFFFPTKKIDPFVKIFAGSSLISAISKIEYTNQEDNIIKNQIYEYGTKNSTEPKKAAFHYGIGAGLNYHLSEKFAFYLDGNLSVINSNLLDGIPNNDYFFRNNSDFFSPSSAKSMVSQISFGLVFTTLKFEIPTIKKKSSGVKKGGGKTTKYLPFYREK